MATTPAPHPGKRVTAAAEAAVPARRPLPRHIAIIMDGNGRWAQHRGLPRIEGHRQGIASVRRATEHCARLGVEQLTLYCLSSENWRRPRLELDFLMHLLEQYMMDERELLMKERIRVSTIGRRDGLPAATLAAIDRTTELCSANDGMRLCLAVNYGGRGEIADAARSLAKDARDGLIDPETIDESMLASRLDTAGMPDPDLLIRTAGEMRISNFLLWQISYAELWVTDALWPDFGEEHLDAAIASFAARERRFGGLAQS